MQFVIIKIKKVLSFDVLHMLRLVTHITPVHKAACPYYPP